MTIENFNYNSIKKITKNNVNNFSFYEKYIKNYIYKKILRAAKRGTDEIFIKKRYCNIKIEEWLLSKGFLVTEHIEYVHSDIGTTERSYKRISWK